MLSDVLPPGLLTPNMLVNLKKMAIYIALFWGPWFLQARFAPIAPRLDLELGNYMHIYVTIDATIANPVICSLERHMWYLTEELVVYGLFDSDLDSEARAVMAACLLRTPR